MGVRARGKTKTVLFIDDETPWLSMIKTAVEDAPFEVITADSGEAALRKIKRKKPDLILSDVRMPTMNGFDLFEKIRSNPRFRDVPYVFMSSIDDFDARRTAKEIGADDYVEKPIDTEQVESIVIKLLTRFKDNRH
jgi:YesN/AraC family two-component response regulator